MYNLADNFANAVQYEGDNSEFMVRVTLLCTISQTTLPMLYNMKVTIVSLWYVLHYYESFTVITSSIRTRKEKGNKLWRRKKQQTEKQLLSFSFILQDFNSVKYQGMITTANRFQTRIPKYDIVLWLFIIVFGFLDIRVRTCTCFNEVCIFLTSYTYQ